MIATPVPKMDRSRVRNAGAGEMAPSRLLASASRLAPKIVHSVLTTTDGNGTAMTVREMIHVEAIRQARQRYPVRQIAHGHHCPTMDNSGPCDCGADEELAFMEARRDGFIEGWKSAMSSSET